MAIRNSDIAAVLTEMADLLELSGDNPFRVRAYRNAARTISELAENAADLVAREEDLTRLPGIGRDLAGKISELVRTGKLAALEEIKGTVPSALGELMLVSGLGPKRIRTLHAGLGIENLEDLKKAAGAGRIRKLEGFGAKTENNIQAELERLARTEGRTLLPVADEIARSLTGYLQETRGLKELVVAGSYRRRRETVGDLDILVTVGKGCRIMPRFVEYEDVEKVISQGETRASIRLRSGFQVDLRVLPEESYGAALHYFTGSKAHNIAIRKLGAGMGLKINEYGVFKGEKRIAGRSEEEVYARVGLPCIEPELRENRGEIEAARENRLPALITLDDIRGDLHAHTSRTDGRATPAEMAEAAGERGYEYLAITEHSRHVSVARGLDEKELREHTAAIRRLDEELDGITLLAGIEVDILDNGELDLPDTVLAELDLVICSVHYKFNLSRDRQTERIIRAMDNPRCNIIAHPSGRLLQQRDPYDVDMERLIAAAGERGCFLELNAHPERLDLTDLHCRQARDAGVRLAISTDAHSPANLSHMSYGIGQARRGWLEPDDVINTRHLRELKQLLRR